SQVDPCSRSVTSKMAELNTQVPQPVGHRAFQDHGASMDELKTTKPAGKVGWLVSMASFLSAMLLFASTVSATTIVPISDKELRSRADVVVRGIVVSTDVA